MGGYTLVVCEKPDAARKISEALSGGAQSSSLVEGVTVYRFRRGTEEFVVCSAQGHVYAVSDPFKERAVYPVFDAEWYPLDAVEKGGGAAARRIAAVRSLAGGAGRLINACDFDAEGETIGFNILRYACGGREGEAARAKFSTLTADELVESFGSARPAPSQGLAAAGRTRHLLDFMWGVNLSRALSRSARPPPGSYRTVSIGRVQGPTLKFLAEREREIQEFVPTPFWKARGVFRGAGASFTADYSEERIESRSAAARLKDDCEGREAVVTEARTWASWVPPPPPLSTGDLQREAYRAFGIPPGRTMQVAERLYLRSLISYPRTGSQRLPPSINYRGILLGLEKIARYSKEAGGLLRGALRPVAGAGADPAHPAIHPTGEAPRGALDSSEAKVFDLVVRRFLSAFAPPAKREMARVTLAVGEHRFVLEGGRTVFPGWLAYDVGRRSWKDSAVPQAEKGDRFRVVEVQTEERFDQRPPRYTQGSLLEKMEREGIGTKSTRAETISTLLSRGYAAGESLAVTGLGFSVVEVMESWAPPIVTTELTRRVEEKLEAVETGSGDGKDLVRETVRSISEQMVALRENQEAIGREIGESLAAAAPPVPAALGPCPVCGTGALRMIRSRKTGKRFAGCTNYPSGCRASAPLPQRGTLRALRSPCPRCSWPVVYVLGRGRPWKLCINPACPSKVKG